MLEERLINKFVFPLIKYTGKSSWPELVGVKGQRAVATIEKENPRVEAIIVLVGQLVTYDVRYDRVRVWVDARGVVIQRPYIG